MIELRPITDADISCINKWPTYPSEFQDLDYALRKGGWFDEFYTNKNAEILVADDQGKLFGLLILSRETGNLAEIRIALHPNKIGKGYGKVILEMLLKRGFSDISLKKIRLVVRKNNPRAKKLYEKLNFQDVGDCVDEIHGKKVELYAMEIDRATFLKANHSAAEADQF